MLMFGLPSIN